MSEVILGLLKGLLGKLVIDEFNAACPSIAKRLIKESAATLGQDAARYQEQWLADMEDQKTPLRKLSFAIGLIFASKKLRKDAASMPNVTPSISEERKTLDEPSENINCRFDNKELWRWVEEQMEDLETLSTEPSKDIQTMEFQRSITQEDSSGLINPTNYDALLEQVFETGQIEQAQPTSHSNHKSDRTPEQC